MNRNRIALLCAVGTLFCSVAQAQLAFDVSPPKAAGRKVVVPLALKNDFAWWSVLGNFGTSFGKKPNTENVLAIPYEGY